MSRYFLVSLVALCLCVFGHAAEPEIVFIAPSNHAMPWALFKDGKLSDGLLKDLGELIAARLVRKAKFITLPSNRVRGALSAGTADALCYVRPEWLDGHYNWTPSLIQDGAAVVARIDAPVIQKLANLHNVPVGTVIGYRYPEIESALGQGFVREDAPSMESNLRKLIAGRMDYAILEKMVLDYYLQKDQSIKLRVDLLYITFEAQCAFSLSSKIPFTEVTRVIKLINEDGSANEIFSRYR